MKKLILAAALTIVAAPAFAHELYASDNTPNNPTNPVNAYDRFADSRDYARDDSDRMYARDRGYYTSRDRDYWRDRATPSPEAMRDRDDGERAWDGLPHYY